MGFVVKDVAWDALGYTPHPPQRIVHGSIARHRRLAGGRRLGKSVIGGREFTPEAMYTYSILPALDELRTDRIFWIVGPDYSDCEKEFRVVYDDFKRLEFPFDKPGTYDDTLHGNMHISLWGGRMQIHAKSALYPKSLDGEGLAGVECVEAAKLKEFVWIKFLRPSLADMLGWSLMTSTPEGKNWFYDEWQHGQDPAFLDHESWRIPSWENPVIFPGGRDDPEIKSFEQDMSEERFNQEIGASFSEYVGAVFKDFDETIHVKNLMYRPDLPLVIACDYGWTNPFVALAIQWDVFDNVFVIGEYRVERTDILDIARDLQDKDMFRNATNLFPDPADPEWTAVLERLLRVRGMGDTGGLLKNRLELIRKWLRLDPASEGHPPEKRQPKLFIDRSCIGLPLGDGGLIREMQDYRYPDTKKESIRSTPEQPLDKDNHGPEALGRFFAGHFGGLIEEPHEGRAKIRKAVIRR